MLLEPLNLMPEHWKHILQHDLGALLATLAGAALRGLLGPGNWVWKEFWLASLTGGAFAIWVAPAIVDYYEFSDSVYGGICLGFGMTALPISRGIIRLARWWAGNSDTIIERNRDDV